jgi:hypothetical protein
MASTNGASPVQPPSYEIFSASTNKTHYNLVAALRIGKIIHANKHLIRRHWTHFLVFKTRNRNGSHGQGGTILVIRGRATRYGSDSALPTGGGDSSRIPQYPRASCTAAGRNALILPNTSADVQWWCCLRQRAWGVFVIP